MPNSLYDVLEISRTASREAIVSAYKDRHSTLAARINGIEGADQDTLDRMTALREAFHILSDPGLRRDYDRQLAAGERQGSATAPRTARPFFKSLSLLTILGLFGVGYAHLASELESSRQEQERIKAEALIADLQLEREREAQRLAAQADFQRRRDEAMERFLREQTGSAQLRDGRPSAKIRS